MQTYPPKPFTDSSWNIFIISYWSQIKKTLETEIKKKRYKIDMLFVEVGCKMTKVEKGAKKKKSKRKGQSRKGVNEIKKLHGKFYCPCKTK